MLSNNLRLFRTNLGMSQIYLAKKLSISRQAYSLYETGQRTPTLESLIKLSVIFDVTIEELVGSDFVEKSLQTLIIPTKKAAPPEDEAANSEKQLQAKLNSLPSDMRDEALRYIDYLISRDDRKDR